ncbi:uncharacterized protein LOC105381901 [Plutella xylostella]|uniref:uncharacterized protein LOC105381901 n=1 Tax=Plutella xylostella TaxID=51655 RepID=UPI0005D0598D|nr:uncharacterized protein LOC105381901 [Plutella xylostella]XP_037975524.2 uncharacterized protein LOC105381901 [Plutella xylostella]
MSSKQIILLIVVVSIAASYATHLQQDAVKTSPEDFPLLKREPRQISASILGTVFHLAAKSISFVLSASSSWLGTGLKVAAIALVAVIVKVKLIIGAALFYGIFKIIGTFL